MAQKLSGPGQLFAMTKTAITIKLFWFGKQHLKYSNIQQSFIPTRRMEISILLRLKIIISKEKVIGDQLCLNIMNGS